jgi:hypothetical protein
MQILKIVGLCLTGVGGVFSFQGAQHVPHAYVFQIVGMSLAAVGGTLSAFTPAVHDTGK